MSTLTALLSLLLPATTLACAVPPRPDPETPKSSCKLPADPSVELSIGFDSPGDCVPGAGTVRALMLFVDFSDAEASEDESPEELRDFFLPDAADWFNKASYGTLDLDVTADITKFYRMPASAASYNWEAGFTWEQHQAYIQDALDAYTDKGARSAPEETDILYVVPTRNAGNLVSRSVAFNSPIDTRQGDRVARRTITFGTDTFETWGFKALNHETGHAFCLPDYYPLTGDFPTGYYVGGWSAMGDIAGVGPDFFAWDKWRLGWISDDAVDCVAKSGTTEHILTPLEVQGGKKAVVIAASTTSAVVAEVRVAGGLDPSVCAPGVLLYTVDTTKASGDGPIRVLDANPNSRGCGGDDNAELNDSTLSLESGSSSYEVPGWGLKVTLVEASGEKYKIRVEYQ
ncbi:hypothetical protein ACJ41O_006439 [Fusarium nematophilum]